MTINTFQHSEEINNDNLGVHALIVAAGKGSRFGSDTPKQYAKINGKTILEHTVSALTCSQKISHLFLVIAPDDKIAKTLSFPLSITFVQGGTERWESVQAGVAAIMESGAGLQDLVVIHDAARPCVLQQHVDAVINIASYERFGAILGVPIVDTIKQVIEHDLDGSDNSTQQNDKQPDQSNKLMIQKTVDRSRLWKAQTPQVFRLGKLKKVLDNVAKDNLMITDEASAFEINGHSIRMVEGSHQNIKLTYQEDLALIEMIMDSRELF